MLPFSNEINTLYFMQLFPIFLLQIVQNLIKPKFDSCKTIELLNICFDVTR